MNALELYTKIVGNGPPLVILHGLFGSWENWGSQIRQLADHFTVYAMDARNHGKSPHSDMMNYNLMADDVTFTMNQMGIRSAAMVGHSMGGKTAMQLALKDPERISKLMVVDIAPKTYKPGHNEIFEALCRLDLSQIQHRSEADKQVAELIPDLAVRAFVLKNLTRDGDSFSWKMNLAVIKQNYNAIIGDLQDASPFDKSTLFVKGANSDYIESDSRERIATLFPKAKAKIIDGAGHWPHAEKPAVFYKIARDFLLDDDKDSNRR